MNARGRVGDLHVALLLAFASFLACGGPHIAALGFYRDDWVGLLLMRSGSWAERFRLMAAQPGFYQRPLNVPESLFAYWLYGSNPLGWHLELAAIGALTAFCVWRILRAFQAPETLALPGALLFLAYPSKDTALFWAGYINGPLALLAFLAGYLAHLNFVETGRKTALAAALAAFAFSLGTYDSCLFLAPILLLTPRRGAGTARNRAWTSLAGLIFLMGASAAWRLTIMGRHQAPSLVQFSPTHALSVYVASINANLGPDALLSAARAVARAFAAWPVTAAAALLLPGLVLLVPEAAPEGPDRRSLKRLVLLGAAIYVLGYLPIAVSQYFPAPTAEENRLNLVPVVGLVLACVGALSLLRTKSMRYALALAAGLAAVSSVGIAGSWADAYTRELAVRDLVLRRLPEWPKGDVLFLLQQELHVDGRAPVFDHEYILNPAVRLWTGDDARRSYVVRPGVEFLPEGLRLDGKTTFPYNRLVLLDASSGTLAVHSGYDFIRRLAIPGTVHNPVATWVNHLLRRP